MTDVDRKTQRQRNNSQADERIQTPTARDRQTYRMSGWTSERVKRT